MTVKMPSRYLQKGKIMLDKKSLRKLSKNLVANPDDYMSSFRKNLYMYIDQKEITLAEVADQADISMSTLRSLMYGDAKDCHVSTVVNLAKALNVSCDELLGSGTISPQTCESLQLVRQMPESFTHFVRWAIHYHYKKMTSGAVSPKSVEIMNAICCENGNLKMTNDFDIIDIGNLGDDVRPKIFMGIKIPCEHFVPDYYPGDILLLANDRSSKRSEHVVVTVGDYMWIVNRKEEIENGAKVENYYSLRDNRKRPSNDDAGIVIGYVTGVIRNMD